LADLCGGARRRRQARRAARLVGAGLAARHRDRHGRGLVGLSGSEPARREGGPVAGRGLQPRGRTRFRAPRALAPYRRALDRGAIKAPMRLSRATVLPLVLVLVVIGAATAVL